VDVKDEYQKGRSLLADEGIPIIMVSEDLASFYTPDGHVVEKAGGV